jgi:hypothetical protein
MSVYVVYHNTDNEDLQRIPFARGKNPFDRFYDDWISTSRQSTLKQAVAERGWCLFIVGLGKPKRFYLWAYFQFLPGAEAKTGAGEGWMLNPPQRLEGPAFKHFRDNECGQFGNGLQNVSNSPFVDNLISVAGEYHKPKITRETLRFCSELRSLSEDGGNLNADALELEQYVRRALGRSTGQKKAAPQKPRPAARASKTTRARKETRPAKKRVPARKSSIRKRK